MSFLAGEGWRVYAGKTISWPVESKSSGIDKILLSMRTDIVLDNSDAGRRIVIDTKFNSVVTRGWYREENTAKRICISDLRLLKVSGRQR